MIVKNKELIPFVEDSGYEGVEKKYFIGRKDGSGEIIMRYFVVAPQKSTPYHAHEFPHLVKVEKGEGVLVDKDKNEKRLNGNSLVYVHDNETHCFRNTSTTENFEFICIVPERGDKG